MTALPYTLQWVGAATAVPPADNQWHLQHKREGWTFCGIDNPEPAITLTCQAMRDQKRNDKGACSADYQCKACQYIFQTTLYIRLEQNEYMEDLRA